MPALRGEALIRTRDGQAKGGRLGARIRRALPLGRARADSGLAARLGRFLLPLALLFGAMPAAAATADIVCGSPPADAKFPNETALVSTAAQAEQLLAAGDPASLDEAVRILDVEATSAERPGAPALAAYCSAAGEVMRVSPLGSQAQAHTFLTTAFRSAPADAPRLSARTAYRLGLVAVSAPGGSTTRGSNDEEPAPPATSGGVTAAYLASAERTEIDSF